MSLLRLSRAKCVASHGMSTSRRDAGQVKDLVIIWPNDVSALAWLFSPLCRPLDDTEVNTNKSKHFQGKAFTSCEMHILTRNLQFLAACDWFS